MMNNAFIATSFEFVLVDILYYLLNDQVQEKEVGGHLARMGQKINA